ncbi:MAG: ureidoglycolate hydrolase [Acidimicrobiia bacterium]|nr:ureidoglycolate hydrolase [Acidimicrobiia bacterium]
MKMIARPLNAEAFAPYGDVLAPPAEPGRVYFEKGLKTGRAGAWPSLSTTHSRPLEKLPLEAKVLERHEFSSQSFFPLDVSRWLLIVAPSSSGGGPDASRAVAFVAGPGQGVTYHMGTWHHGLTVLDRPARFAVFMWRDGTSADEEFVTLAAPFTVEVPI